MTQKSVRGPLMHLIHFTHWCKLFKLKFISNALFNYSQNHIYSPQSYHQEVS